MKEIELLEASVAAPMESKKEGGAISISATWERPPLGMKALSSRRGRIKLRLGVERCGIRGRMEIRLHSRLEESPITPREMLLAKRSHFKNIFEANLGR